MTDLSGIASTAASQAAPALHPKHAEWLAKRGIQLDTATRMGLHTSMEGGKNWLVFPYHHHGEQVNRKLRTISDKDMRQDKDAKLVLWNEACLRSPLVERGEFVIITEGEIDALTAIECGFLLTVSVPNGAPNKATDDPMTSNRYRFLWESEKELETVKKFVIATDGDGPGKIMAHDLARILGAERCLVVDYPEGTKDLNEIYQEFGYDGVVSAINGARNYPVQGLHDFFDLPELEEIVGIDTGIDTLDGKIQIVPKTLTVFTGYSNMGKSTVINTIVANCAARNVTVAIASFETMGQILFDGITKAMIGCSKSEFANHPQRAAAQAHVNKYVKMISNSLQPDMEFTLDTFLDAARMAVLRDGAKVVILDPWNELEHKRNPGETMTEYVGRALRRFKSFLRQYDISLWIVAHPTKPIKGTNDIPTLYDISDSANWANKADYGLVYHRPDREVNEADLAVVKVRMGLPGEVSCQSVKFDYRTSRINGITS